MKDGYKVGNLEITFKAIDKASASFDTLKNNLEAVKSAIESFGGISQKSLDKFGKVIDAISAKFAPLLVDIKGATKGIAAFNQVVQKVGVKGISQAAAEMERLKKETPTNITETADESGVVPSGEADKVVDEIKTKIKFQQSLNEQLFEQQQLLRNTRAEWRKAFMGGDEDRAHELYVEIENITNKITSLKGEIKEMATATEAEMEEVAQVTALSFSEAKSQISQLVQELTEARYVSGEIDWFKVEELRAKKSVLDETTEAVKRAMMTEQELALYEFNSENAARKQRIEFLELMLATGKAGEKTREFRIELAKLQKEQGNTEKSTRKATSSFSKLFKQIKRIAVYRLIRTALRKISQAFTETIQAFASVDDNINDTMSNITSSLSIIKLSLGSAVLPILQIIEPIVQQIAVGLANVANLIGQAMSKTGTYTKINIEAWKNYRKELNKTQGALFDFDKFRSLNNTKQSNLSDFLLPNQEVDENNEKVTKLRETFEKLSTVFEKIFNIVSKVGSTAFSVFLDILDKVLDVVTPIIEGISNLIDKLDEMGLLKPIIEGVAYALLAVGAVKVIKGLINVASAIKNVELSTLAMYAAVTALVAAISYFVSNLDNMNSTAKVLIPVIAALAAVFTGLAVAKAAAAAGIAAPIKAGITAAALAAAITLAAGTAIAVGVGKYAEGGLPDKGTMFIAGEAGAEMVYNMPNGQSGVANISQIAQADYQGTISALNEWWKTARNDIPQFKEVSGTGIYELNRSQSIRRGQTTVKV